MGLPGASHLISEEHFDGEAARSRWGVLDGDGVVGIRDNVKVKVFLFVAEHVCITLDAHTHISCRLKVIKDGFRLGLGIFNI